MHISKVELENIKSHSRSTFEFTRGTTAITGENGAGKTTIIEAVAWVLFDFLPDGYKKEDFVRRGQKKGSVRITFESGLDEREYVVSRDSGTAYNVTDPRLGMRIADKKEEVFRFLWQHLALEPGTDLKSLFRQAIGVPQGTFTAIFLEGATERKVAFDRLLKVEEYRQAAEKLRDTQRYIETGIVDIRERTARYEGELSRAALVDEEFRTSKEKTGELTMIVDKLDAEVGHKRLVVTKLDELERIENAILGVRSDQKYLVESLAAIKQARIEIDALKPKIDEQEKLESRAVKLRQEIADLRAVEKQAADLDQMIERMRENYRTNLTQLKEAKERSQKAGKLAALEDRNASLVLEIATLQASLERDEKFQREIKGGFCPVLTEKCLNLKPGQTLEAFVASQFDELRAQITIFETEKKSVATDLRIAREAERFAAQLDGLLLREQQLKAEGQQLASKRAELGGRVAGLVDLEKQLDELESAALALGDPRSRVKYLENETTREGELRDMQAKSERSLVSLENDRERLFGELEAERFVVNAAVYDPAQHAGERVSLHEADKRLAELRATLEAVKARERQLAAEIGQFAEIRKTLQVRLQEKEKLELVCETTAFIRETLKEAAPRVARNYVYHVSVEAAQMFREIMGNAEKTLKWNEDYSITLEQDGFERPFPSLSGGEQMAAALAVRLALLKQLSDIRIAFFDEPTANMDVERRENFAVQLGRITHFDQLFVISHDDAFDQYADNVITLGK